MLFLLIAVVMCLAIPWIPYVVYRRLPRRPRPPVSDEELQRLALENCPDALPRATTSALPRRKPARAVVTSEEGPRFGPVEGSTDEEDVSPSQRTGDAPKPRRKPAPRSFVLPSHGWVNAVVVVFMIVCFLALGVGYAAVFHILGEARSRALPPSIFRFEPFAYGVVCFLAALLLGICTSILPGMLLARLLLGRRRFHEFLFHGEGRGEAQGGSRARIMRVLAGLALFVSIGSALYIWQVMNWHLSLTEDHIAIKRLAAFREEIHPYEDVEQIVLTSHERYKGNVFPRDNLHLRFRDGRSWATDETFVLPRDQDQRHRLLDFLRQKTGKPITRARLVTDVPGW
jgi:hypothetical protein